MHQEFKPADMMRTFVNVILSYIGLIYETKKNSAVAPVLRMCQLRRGIFLGPIPDSAYAYSAAPLVDASCVLSDCAELYVRASVIYIRRTAEMGESPLSPSPKPELRKMRKI